MAVDRRARVIAEEERDEKIFIDAVDLGVSGYFKRDTYYPIKGKARRGFRLAALNIVSKRTMDRIGVESGLRLTIKSDIPIAVGLGSSAAVSVATVAAVGELLGGDLDALGVIDGVIAEPAGGAQRDLERAAAAVGDRLDEALESLAGVPPDELVERRLEKYARMGRFMENGRPGGQGAS